MGGGGGVLDSRHARLDFDLDNNGTIDATETIAYDAVGRVVSTHYDYVGDGIPDRIEAFGSIDQAGEFGYNADGTLARLFSQDANGTLTFEFVYAGGPDPVRADVSGATSGDNFSGQYVFAYDAGRMTRSETVFEGGTVAVDTFGYDAFGRRTLASSGSPGSPDTSDTVYRWNDDGTLAEVLRDLDADGSNVRYVLSYTNGLQVGTVKTVSGQPGYSVSFAHDADGRLQRAEFDVGSDGSVDAVWTLTWEAGPCRTVVLPLFDPLIDSITGYGSSVSGEYSNCF